MHLQQGQLFRTDVFAGHHTDATEDAVLAGNNFKPVGITALIAGIQHETRNPIEPCGSQEFTV